MSRFQPKYFTPELRGQVAAAAVTIREAVTAARQDGANHLALVQRWADEKAAHQGTGASLGETDPWYYQTATRDQAIGQSDALLIAEKQRLREVCTGLGPLIGQITLAARRQIGEEVSALLAPYYSAGGLERTAYDTELSNNVSVLFMRLRQVQAHDFVGALRHAELVLRVFEDLLADREVLSLQPLEALAA